ncbi:MAG: alkene reductase [Planctomycetota bacterium]
MTDAARLETASLFSSATLGPYTLPNRVLMAPMTRCRASLPGEVPTELNATYYRQRASAGLIFTEATHVSPGGLGYVAMPGIYSDAQRDGWKLVTDAVHDAGGRIFAQLYHAGRVTHPELLPDDLGPVAPSAIALKETQAHTPSGKHDIPAPHALTADEIAGVVEDFRHAAQVAKDAGFDGVQLHGANGYLIDEFLRDGTNQRTDDFGGSTENRLRFPLQVLAALIDVWGPERVGLRVSPTGTFNEMSDSNPLENFTAIFESVDQTGIGHLEVVGQLFDQPEPHPQQDAINAAAREKFSRTLIFNGDYTVDKAQAALVAGACDLITFGRPFLANPDLPARLQVGAALADFTDPTLLYNPMAGEKGYTEFPPMAEASA